MKFIQIAFISLLPTFFSIQTIQACVCYKPPPPCFAYSQSDAVFVGTVKEIKSATENFPFRQISIAIDKNYKGIISPEVFTETGSSSCDFPGFKENERFLIYGNLHKNDKSRFVTGACTRSRTFDEKLIDFEFFEALASPTPNYWVWGTFSVNSKKLSVEGIKAEVLDDQKILSGISDKNGNLKIVVSKAGKYTVRVYFPNNSSFKPSYDIEEQRDLIKRSGKNKKGVYVEYEVEVKNNQCGWIDAGFDEFEK